MRGITVIPAQIGGQCDVSLSEGTLIWGTEHTVGRMDGGIRTGRRRYIQGLMHDVLVTDDWHPHDGVSLTEKRRVARRAVKGVTAHGRLFEFENRTAL